MLLLTLRETYALNRLSSLKNLRWKGGKFDHRPGQPKVLLRHCNTLLSLAFMLTVHAIIQYKAATAPAQLYDAISNTSCYLHGFNSPHCFVISIHIFLYHFCITVIIFINVDSNNYYQQQTSYW